MDQWEVLRQLCPRLYKNGLGFECALGWYDIIRDLSVKIEGILEKDAEKYQTVEGEENDYIEMFAVQVKEKYGTLRFYMSCETEEISDFIREAERKSATVCEVCGSLGALTRQDSTEWYVVRCDKCYEEKR